MHNVPFKWCNADLEGLFDAQAGYLDAQLLFHENGRSKGVGVVLFCDVVAASDAIARLSGSHADGRKLELVLMSPDNHISFSCRQVCVCMLCTVYVSMCASASVCVQQGHCLLCVRPGTACGTAALSATAAADYVQVAVLGLPWEYTSGDVRALLETAAEAAGLAPEEAGAETVAVAYREDGKSEVRQKKGLGFRVWGG